jgi:hypothetical protein
LGDFHLVEGVPPPISGRTVPSFDGGEDRIWRAPDVAVSAR